MSAQIISALSALLGAAVGGLASYFGSYKLWEKRRAAHEEQTAKALLGEIRAMIRIVDRRNYADELREVAQTTRASRLIHPYRVPVQQDYFRVFKANLEQLGQLQGDLPERIATVYTLANGLVEDFNALADVDHEQLNTQLQNLPARERTNAAERWADRLEETAGYLEESMTEAQEVADEIAGTYG